MNIPMTIFAVAVAIGFGLIAFPVLA